MFEYTDQFEHRSIATYFSGEKNTSSPGCKTASNGFPVTRPTHPLVTYASCRSNAILEWGDLLTTNFSPYEYQIEAFRLSQLTNLIVVIPTGEN